MQGNGLSEKPYQLTYNTIPMLFKQRYEKRDNRKVCMRCKRLGVWQEYNYEQCYTKIKYISLAMVSLGAKLEDKITVIGTNAPEYFWAEYGAMGFGGAVVGIHPQAVSEEIRYILEHSETKFVFVEGREQIDKVLFLKDQGHIPLVKGIFYWNPKDIWVHQYPIIYSFDEMLEMGKRFEVEHVDSFEKNLEKIKPEDISLCFYTSGIGGLPKGVMVSHQQLLCSAVVMLEVERWGKRDNIFSCTNPIWMVEQIICIGRALLSEAVINFAGGPETIDEDIRELGPTILFYDASTWENVASRIHERIEASSGLGKHVCHWALNMGYKKVQMEEQGGKGPFFWKALYVIAYRTVLRPILDKFGFVNIRIAWTTGKILNPKSFRFIRALGVPLRQIYGTAEMAIITLHHHRIKHSSVGEVFDGGEVKIGPNNEILSKGPNLFKGYYKNPELMRKAIDKDGWFHSGDAGFFDQDNQLICMGRLEEMLNLPNGSKFSLQHIENELRISPVIKECIAICDANNSYVAVLIDIEIGVVSKWIEAYHIPSSKSNELTESKEVYEVIAKEIEKTNQNLPEPAKIKKFAFVSSEFAPEQGEISRTGKLRRQFVEKKYQKVINKLCAKEKIST
jgi:long-chain acyl-CoA synthetase